MRNANAFVMCNSFSQSFWISAEVVQQAQVAFQRINRRWLKLGIRVQVLDQHVLRIGVVAEIRIDCVQQDYIERTVAAVDRRVGKNICRKWMSVRCYVPWLMEAEIHHLLRLIVFL